MIAGVLVVLSAAGGTRQTAAQQTGPAVHLADYEGQYQYQDNTALFIVAAKGRLSAVLGDGKYPLRASSTDTFVNATGDAIPFSRDASGRVAAFGERGETFRRLSPDVPATVRALFEARPEKD